MPASQSFQVGDFVIYRKTKFSSHPGPRAHDIQPARNGDDYCYIVDKFWVVKEVTGREVLLQTRRGKIHRLNVTDPGLRKASLLERWFYRQSFPVLGESFPPDADDESGLQISAVTARIGNI